MKKIINTLYDINELPDDWVTFVYEDDFPDPLSFVVEDFKLTIDPLKEKEDFEFLIKDKMFYAYKYHYLRYKFNKVKQLKFKVFVDRNYNINFIHIPQILSFEIPSENMLKSPIYDRFEVVK